MGPAFAATTAGGERDGPTLRAVQGEAGPAGETADAVEQPSTRPRILVADDEPAMRLLLRVNLGLSGFDVTDVGDGEAALTALQQPGAFDFALLDVMMPGLSGHDVARRLPVGGTPIAFLSARASLDDQRTGYELGAVDYIVKPFDAIAIGDRLRELLARVEDGTAEQLRLERLARLERRG
jgi:DNA-binding response OmpR family regulator